MSISPKGKLLILFSSLFWLCVTIYPPYVYETHRVVGTKCVTEILQRQWYFLPDVPPGYRLDWAAYIGEVSVIVVAATVVGILLMPSKKRSDTGV